MSFFVVASFAGEGSTFTYPTKFFNTLLPLELPTSVDSQECAHHVVAKH